MKKGRKGGGEKKKRRERGREGIRENKKEFFFFSILEKIKQIKTVKQFETYICQPCYLMK